MSLSIHTAVAPPALHALTQLRHLLAKGDAHAQAQGWDPAVLLNMRLSPDMLPLTRQVQIASDIAKNAFARLTGTEAPKLEDTETTFAELDARLQRAITYMQSVPAAAFEGTETRTITVPLRSGDQQFVGTDYVFQFVLPNIYFHNSITYAILRHAGVPLGKTDFLGQPSKQG